MKLYQAGIQRIQAERAPTISDTTYGWGTIWYYPRSGASFGEGYIHMGAGQWYNIGTIQINSWIQEMLSAVDLTGYEILAYNQYGRAIKADPSAEETCRVAGFNVTGEVNAGDSLDVQYIGLITNSAWSFSSDDVGKFVYVDPDTPGSITTDKPDPFSNQVIQPVGRVHWRNQIIAGQYSPLGVQI